MVSGDLIPLDDLRAMLAQRAADLAQHLLGDPNRQLSSKRELRYGTHGSFAVSIAGSKLGCWYDHEIGIGGDPFALIMRERNCDFRDAVEFARLFAGGNIYRTTIRPLQLKQSDRGDEVAKRLQLARFLWSQRQPIKATAGERYLREARGYGGAIPPTIGYLPTRGKDVHAIICAFGLPDEREPGALHMRDDAVRGVHLIRLLPDGSDRDRDHPQGKSTIGKCPGAPIVCAPFHDSSNALVIAEGVEDALTAHEVMGIGAWAAGGASRMPALAESIPDWTDCASILIDDNSAGRVNTAKLERSLQERGVEVWEIQPFELGSDAP
ncbi:hypothetical protein XH99_22310 [Bradyrhizobium nanningense]|uniref:Uncharacterized protein n=1 Tax=Bradyrhizobium nanningense TaxID=1325118 RepID=A0A4Q0S1J3_9BRAD|nr:toprim domain-containing protein [Bradyrhizobium nanningense]RXH25843.1 hypothetical protein XH99_22310 [Bradyrhizobium nanningense]RXH28721.1 hypothetical protein XH84_24005 [Bradyrhizobium nanningense]